MLISVANASWILPQPYVMEHYQTTEPNKTMGLFDRFRSKKHSPASDYERFSALGDDPDAWEGLDDDELKQIILIKCIEYGVSQDGSRIPALFGLYRHAVTQLDVNDRLEMLTEFSRSTEEQHGKGHMGLMMFLAADDNPAVQSSAALSLSVLYDPEDGDELAGPAFVVRTLLNRENDPEAQGIGLGGVLLLGDKRIMPLLEEAWEQLSEAAQLAMTKAKSGIVSEGIVEFWLNCLESGCSESVFGSVVAAIAKLPAIAQVPLVVDIERLFPAYAGGEPMRPLRRTSFADYLEEIRPRLEALEEVESEPKLIPKIYEIWKNPEPFRGLIG
jgi:hypothetical protein